MDTLFFSLILTVVLMIGIWYLWFFEYRRYLVDSTRQRLFSIRDELFTAAAIDSKIDVENPLYGMTRNTLNGAIQYAHDLSATHFLITTTFYHKAVVDTPQMKEYQKRWEKAFSETESESEKKLILKAHKDMHLAIFRHIVKGSLVLRILLPIAALILMAKKRHLEQAITSKKARESWSILDAEANSIGERMAIS